MISIEFNGQAKEVSDTCTIADLLRESNVESRFCAVELNLEIVPRDQYSEQRLKSGDQLEVVTLVGGG
jgi:sulfur carrier protein